MVVETQMIEGSKHVRQRRCSPAGKGRERYLVQVKPSGSNHHAWLLPQVLQLHQVELQGLCKEKGPVARETDATAFAKEVSGFFDKVYLSRRI